jgi:hypothetical protein
MVRALNYPHSCASFSASHYGRLAYDAPHMRVSAFMLKAEPCKENPVLRRLGRPEAGIKQGDKNESCIVQRVWAA